MSLSETWVRVAVNQPSLLGPDTCGGNMDVSRYLQAVLYSVAIRYFTVVLI